MVMARMAPVQAVFAVTAFVPGDLLKAIAAALLAEAAYRTYPAALGRAR